MVTSPGFFGLFNAQRGILTAQTQLNTVNHNISNANTTGFTRQRVDIETAFPYQAPTLTSGTLLQIGQGVVATRVSQIRNEFLDERLQTETSAADALGSQADIIRQLDGIIGEPSDTGVSASVQLLFESVESLTEFPENQAARSSFLQQVNDLIDTMQTQGRQLLELHENLVGVEATPATFDESQVGVNVSEFNSRLQTLADLNQEIVTVTGAGGDPNDLFDRRRQTMLALSRIADVEFTELNNNLIRLELGGETLVDGVRLLDELDLVANAGANAAEVPIQIQTAASGVNLTNNIQGGRIRGILDAAGDSATTTTVIGKFTALNNLAETVFGAMNAVQQGGRDLNGLQHVGDAFENIVNLNAGYPGGGAPRLMFFESNQALQNAPENLALAADDPAFPANFGGPGDNRNALALADLRTTDFVAMGNDTFENFYQAEIAKLGIDSRALSDQRGTQQQLISALNEQIASTSGVNVDEETIDLIRFQRAFEASSRMVRTFDEMYQTIINLT